MIKPLLLTASLCLAGCVSKNESGEPVTVIGGDVGCIEYQAAARLSVWGLGELFDGALGISANRDRAPCPQPQPTDEVE